MSILYQYSHFWAVNKGCYDGDLSIAELKAHGNLGLGTFNALNGELVVIDNVFYHCANGKARIANDDEKLPWAAVTKFSIENSFKADDIHTLKALENSIVAQFDSANYPVALSIEAHVKNIALGSVPKQTKPYQPIAEIIDSSILINTGELKVNMVGFYAPGFMYPIKSQGIHLHFVDGQRKVGGHVLDVQLMSAKISYQRLHAAQIIFPQHDDYKQLDLTTDVVTKDVAQFSDRLLVDSHG